MSGSYIIAFLLIAFAPAQIPTSGISAPRNYTLGPGDQVSLFVTGLPDEFTDKTFRIGTNGDINLPFAGRLHAASLSIENLENELKPRFAKFVHDPDVVVTVTEVPRYRTPTSGSERFFSAGTKTGPFVTITSGSLFKHDVLRACGPFAEELFIYVVDDEYSLRLRLRGFEIAQSRRAVLLHAAGAPEPFRIFGKELFTKTNHSAHSRYYLSRNRIWLARRYGKAYPSFCASLGVSAIKDALKIVLAERHKMLKLKRTAEGLRDGLLGRMGKATCLE